MTIALTIIALLVQFAGVYALLIHFQRTQDARSDFAEPANQRREQAYYDAFAAHGSRREGIGPMTGMLAGKTIH